MKLKFVIVDLEIPPRVKKWGLRAGIPAVALFIAAAALAVPAPFADGQVLTAAELTSLQSQITTLQGQVTAITGSSAVSVDSVAPVSVPTESFVNLPFSTIAWDALGEYNASTGFTPLNTGVYQICSSVYWSAAVTSELDAFINGTRFRAMCQGATSFVCGGCVDVSLTAGQQATVSAYQTSGSTQIVTVNGLWSYINIHRVY